MQTMILATLLFMWSTSLIIQLTHLLHLLHHLHLLHIHT